MTEHKLYAIPLTLKQMQVTYRALKAMPDSAVDAEICDQVIQQVSHMIDKAGYDAEDYFDVLGWHPKLAQWLHMYTWRFTSTVKALDRAVADSAIMGRGFTHFVIIPVPKETKQ